TPSKEGFTLEDIQNAAAVIDSGDLVGIAPYRYENVRINAIPVVAAGTDLAGAQKTSPYWKVEGAWPAADGEIMVGATVAENFRISEGDSIEVSFTPEMEDGHDVVEDTYLDFKVTGILDTGGSEEEYVYMSLADLESLTGTAGKADVAELSVSGGGEVLAQYEERINQMGSPVQARLVKRVTASETTVLSKLQALVLLVTVVVLALTMICVATTMTAVVAERRKEIGLRKAIGASDRSIIGEFLGENLMLGGIGGILGSVLGFVFAQQVSIHVFSSSIRFMPLLVPVTILVSVAVTGLSSLLPIRGATQVDPALVLKGE
ncbi:MAG: ABC transporter permease, partial [Oscillospiraceae bacterium]|nr:ABC transporter permease [Oscillospiraceae bacterium]